MVNLRRKARINEKRAEDELVSQGWIVERMQYSGNIWQKRKDFFGLWDIMAMQGDKIRFIQVKTNNHPKLQPFYEFARLYGCEHVLYEIWIWYEAGHSKSWLGWRKIKLKGYNKGVIVK